MHPDLPAGGTQSTHPAPVRDDEAFRTLADWIPQLAWMADASGHIFWYNQRWYDYTGTTAVDMEGWGWKNVHDPAVLPHVMEGWQRSIDTSAPFDMVFPLRGADGTFRPFLTRVVPLKDDEGQVLRWFGTNTDITEQQRTEEALEKARREAEAANRAKSDFLATMSHELRTPLNAILGYTELMELGVPGPINEKQRGFHERVSSSARHLLGLITDILDFSKIEAGKLEVEHHTALAWDAATAALSLVRPQAAARHIVMTDAFTCGRNLRYVGDEDRVRQILVNLLSNSVKFTPADGRISVSCDLVEHTLPSGAEPATWLAIRVLDSGIGIAPEKADAVFEPFVQVDGGSRREHGGTGLGLAISRRLARLMGGDLTLESTLGKGSIFTLWLPAAEGAGAADSASPCEAGVAACLIAQIEPIVAAYVDRLRADPMIGPARDAAQVDLEGHLSAFLADTAQQFAILDEGAPDHGLLIQDGSAIQHLISERHGSQRHRLGWTEEMLRREFAILIGEIERILCQAHPPEAESHLGDLLPLLRHFLRDAAETSMRGFRHAAARTTS